MKRQIKSTFLSSWPWPLRDMLLTIAFLGHMTAREILRWYKRSTGPVCQLTRTVFQNTIRLTGKRCTQNIAYRLRARDAYSRLISSQSKKPMFPCTIGNWLLIRPGTNVRPLLSEKYSPSIPSSLEITIRLNGSDHIGGWRGTNNGNDQLLLPILFITCPL